MSARPWSLLATQNFRDVRGQLSVFEGSLHNQKAIVRAFWIGNVPAGQIRGRHAHRVCEQYLFCLAGQVRAYVETDKTSETFDLLAGGDGLYVGPMVWGEQEFLTSESVLLVLATMEFSEDDYVRDYRTFLDLAQKRV